MPTAGRLINDVVHGMVCIPPWADEVLNTQLMQRLGRVRQLGHLATAFPSATHTRLEHSIGTFHLAQEYCDVLGMPPSSWTRAFALAALLHDVAHGPFSHSFEKAITGTPTGSVFKNHDAYRHVLLQENAELRTAVGDAYVDDVRAIWDPDHVEPNDPKLPVRIFHALLSGVAGVDRLDYILRDGYHTMPHLKITRSLVQALMRQTVIGDKTVHYTDKGADLLETFLNHRVYMYKYVYLHRRSVAADRAMQNVFIVGLERECHEYVHPDRFAALGDDFVWQSTWRSASEAVRRRMRQFAIGAYALKPCGIDATIKGVNSLEGIVLPRHLNVPDVTVRT